MSSRPKRSSTSHPILPAANADEELDIPLVPQPSLVTWTVGRATVVCLSYLSSFWIIAFMDEIRYGRYGLRWFSIQSSLQVSIKPYFVVAPLHSFTKS